MIFEAIVGVLVFVQATVPRTCWTLLQAHMSKKKNCAATRTQPSSFGQRRFCKEREEDRMREVVVFDFYYKRMKRGL